MNMHSVPCLMSVLASDCAGKPIQRLWINNLMPSVWDTGAFTSATLCASGEEPRPFPMTSELGWVDADLRFEVECRKPDEVDDRKVAVNLHLHDSWGGLWTTVSVICPPDIFAALDFDRMGHGLTELVESEGVRCPDEDVVFDDTKLDDRDITLVEDVPHCREVVGRLCREITVQLLALGCQLRPVACCCPQALASR